MTLSESPRDTLRKRIAIHHHRLSKLKERKAQLGISADASLEIEIEDIEAEIKNLQVALETLEEKNEPTFQAHVTEATDDYIRRRKRVLVVDDDVEVAKSVEATLRKDYEVRIAYSGIEGIKEARRWPPDIIILDVLMPGMDGFETCRELRIEPGLAYVPILFLTALGGPEDRIAGLHAGADDYLTKAFSMEELKLRIAAILRRISQIPPKPPDPKLKVGGLILNRNSYMVWSKGKVAKLTPVEFDLLYHLMIHPNEVFSSDRLLQEVWDYPSESGSPDIVRKHLRNLRNKIEPDPSNPVYILTIPRRGYILVTDED